jgi:hypothetical protein
MAYLENESIGALVRGAVDDMRELIREEIALARVEVRHEVSKATAAGVQFGAAGVLLLFAGTCLIVAISLGIAWAFSWPAWAGFGIVAILLGIGGALLLSSARHAIRSVEPLPHTVNAIKENFR